MLTLNIIIIIGIIFIVGLVVWLMVIKFEKGDKKYLNGARFENYAPKYANGCSDGIELNVEHGKNGRYLITYIRTDVDEVGAEDLSEKKMIVDRGKRLSFPVGDWSNKISKVKYLPPLSEDIPEEVKHTNFGRILMKLTEDVDVKNAELQTIREGSNRKTDILNKMGDGEVSELQFGILSDFTKNLLKQQHPEESNNSMNRYNPR